MFLLVTQLWQSENWQESHPPAQGSHRQPSITQDTTITLGNTFCPSHSSQLMPNPACNRCLCPLPLSPCKTPRPHVPRCANRRRHLQWAPTWRSGSPRDIPTAASTLLHSESEQAPRRAVAWGNTGWRVAGHSRAVCYPRATRRTENTHHSCWDHSDFYQEIQLLI